GVMFMGPGGSAVVITPKVQQFICRDHLEPLFVKAEGQVIVFRVTIGTKATTGLEIRSISHPARGWDDTFLIDFPEILPLGGQAVQPLLIAPVPITDPPMRKI